MNKVRIGIVGTGFAAELHMEAYKRVYGVWPEVVALVSSSGNHTFAEKHGIPVMYETIEDMIAVEKPDVVDLCTPPSMHASMIETVMNAGCHVICEKPLTGWFGDKSIPDMLDQVILRMDHLRKIVEKSSCHFFYAENFVYAPAVQKSAELLKNTGDRVLFMRGEESHSGSHAAHAALWSSNGGGSLIRQGCHPLSALLYLKEKQKQSGTKVVSVLADMGYIVPALNDKERSHIQARPKDVEDLANVILTFEDGSKAVVTSGDMILGGVRNEIQVYTTGGVHQCKIAPNDQMQVYHVDDAGLGDVYFTEKLETKTGWQSVFLDEDIARGYVDELKDFLLCITGEKEKPEADFQLAYDTIRIIYAAYCSAKEGTRIRLDG